MIFNRDIIFNGKHGFYMSELCGETNDKLIVRNIDLFMIAPLIGYNRNRSEKTEQTAEYSDYKRTINFTQISRESKYLETIFQLIILNDKTTGLSDEEKINLAFRVPFSDKIDDLERKQDAIELFLDYCRGGITYIYETIKENADNFEDELNNMIKLINNYNYLLKEMPENLGEYIESYDLEEI